MMKLCFDSQKQKTDRLLLAASLETLCFSFFIDWIVYFFINSIRNLFSIKGINEMIYKLLVRGVLKKDVLKTFGTYLEKHLC